MKFRVSVLAVLAGAAVASPAAAQSRWADEPGYVQGLPMRVIMREVRARGLKPISQPRLRDRVYVVQAVDSYGRHQRVMVDAASGRVVRVQAMQGGPGRFDEDREYAMRQPPGPPRAPNDMEDYQGMNAPGREGPGREPPLRPRAGLSEDPDMGPQRNASRELPPLRPRAGLPSEPGSEPSMGPQGALPPPPPRFERNASRPASPPPTERNASRPASPSRAERTASRPASPPLPRPRPTDMASAATGTVESSTGSAPAATSAPAAVTPDAHAARHRPLPRVVLPGGPLPKAERTAATAPGRPNPAATMQAEKPAAEEKPAAVETPAAEKPPAGADSAPSATPPAQSYE